MKTIEIKWPEGGSITFDDHEGDTTMMWCAVKSFADDIRKIFDNNIKEYTFTVTTRIYEDDENENN